MDANSRDSHDDSRTDEDADSNQISFRHLVMTESQCIICRRALSAENEVNDGFEPICICRECKVTVLDGNESSATRRDTQQRSQRRGIGRYENSESIDDSSDGNERGMTWRDRQHRRRRRGIGMHESSESIDDSLDGIERSATLGDNHQSRHHRGVGRHGSLEPVDDLFSQQFSQLIGLVRQNHEAQADSEGVITSQQRESPSPSHPSQGRVRRWQRTLSDNETETLYQTDSLFGESDSNISFGGYGESDASVDGHSLFEREMIIQLDNESHTYSDNDRDPMRAGLDQWNSDIDPMRAGLDQWNSDLEDEDGVWEEVNVTVQELEQTLAVRSTSGSNEVEAESSPWNQWRMGTHQHIAFGDIRVDWDDSEEVPPYVGNEGDYLDVRGFEALLEQLADTGSSRRGAPPAAEYAIVKLPLVVISKDHERNGSLSCAVCKDPLIINSEANQLPCQHLYHPSCIVPWLRMRNSCPVCRYELPTDDQEYEEGKRNMERNGMHFRQQDPVDGSSSDDGESESEGVEANVNDQVTADPDNAESINHAAEISNRVDGARGWLFLAAAPLVSIVGIALVLWFRSPVAVVDRRIQCNNRESNHQQLQRSGSASAPADRSRRWWSLF